MVSSYTCRYCNQNFDAGFFNKKTCKKHCPHCWGKFSQIGNIIKTIIKVMILPVIVMVILRFASRGIFDRVLSHAAAVLDPTTVYTYSKDAYLESIIRGRQKQRYFTTTKEMPYYSAMLPKAKLETAEPLGELPASVVIELRSLIRRGENVWVPVFFYIQDKPQQAFLLFPRDWENNITEYDRDVKVATIKTAYETLIKNNFKLMEVKPEDEKEYKEKYNDYFKVKDIGSETFFYAQKTDRSQITNIHSYYLNTNNINMVILQTDKEWERPELVIANKEEEE